MNNSTENDDRGLDLIAEEIRWETRGFEFGAGCTCSEHGDGPPCPHGNHDIQHKITEAQWAKEALKDWKYEDDEEEEDEELDDDWVENEEEDEDECPDDDDDFGDGPVLLPPPPTLSHKEIVEEEVEEPEVTVAFGERPDFTLAEKTDENATWVFNDATGEWEEH